MNTPGGVTVCGLGAKMQDSGPSVSDDSDAVVFVGSQMEKPRVTLLFGRLD